MWPWLFVAAGSGLVLWLSRGSLRTRRAHGFYRFFVFESILGLIAMNASTWFRDPLCPRQLVSWTLLLLSLALVVHGFWLLRRVGRPDPGIHDATRLTIEKTTCLVRIGAYRFIRHPLYASLLGLAWGVFLKAPSWLAGLLAAIATVAAYLTARVEEGENLRNFGDEYVQYMHETHMFIPFVL